MLGIYLLGMGGTLLKITLPVSVASGYGKTPTAVVYILVGGLLILPWRWIRAPPVWWALFIALVTSSTVPILLLLFFVALNFFGTGVVQGFWWILIALTLIAFFMWVQTWAVWRLRAQETIPMPDSCPS